MKYLITTLLLIFPTLVFADYMLKDGSILKYHEEDGVRYVDDSKTPSAIDTDLQWRNNELNYAQKQFDDAKEWDDARRNLINEDSY